MPMIYDNACGFIYFVRSHVVRISWALNNKQPLCAQIFSLNYSLQIFKTRMYYNKTVPQEVFVMITDMVTTY